MEPRFGHDFSKVRVHTDIRAATAASAIAARAFTMGRDIAFGAREYAPHAGPGRWLIAHELAHTIQQPGAAVDGIMAQQPLSAGAPESGFEQEANRAADAVTWGENGAREVSASNSVPPIIHRMPSDGGDDKAGTEPTPAQAPGAPGANLDVVFEAFIPGPLGNSFESYPYPKDLNNQKTFEANVKAVKGTWLKEPGSYADLNTSPWYFATDNRSFGGGSHRLGFAGSLACSQIGSLDGKPKLFTHTTSGSEHVRWTHTGYFTSKNETGSVDGPTHKESKPSSSEEHADNSADESIVTTKGAANYPFKALSPDIDYTVVFKSKRETGGKARLRFEITKNMFPFYELLVNGKGVWRYSASDPGPTIANLTKSDTFKSGDWFF